MDEVFVKTRELGEALLASDAYKAMKEAEDAAMKNAEAADMMGRYLACKQRVEALLAAENPDAEALQKISEEMDACNEKLHAIPDIRRMVESRDAFAKQIERVNQVLRFMVTGKVAGTEPHACGGDCSACGESCHTH